MSPREHSMLRLLDVAAPYWAGEAEIARAYLAGSRRLADELRWLHAQAYKEAYVFLVLPREVRRQFVKTGVLAHPDGGAAAEQVIVEIEHFRLVADLIASLWAPVRMEELVQLPEDGELQRLRRQIAARHGGLGEAVVAFSEGGGGAMYAVLAELDGGAIDRRIAAAFATIARDEMPHGPAQVHTVARHAPEPHDWTLAAELVGAISRQRLVMRNAMFGRPLTPARLDEIARGAIEPWPIADEILGR